MLRGVNLSEISQFFGRKFRESLQSIVPVSVSGVIPCGAEKLAVHTARELFSNLCMRLDLRTPPPCSFLRKNLGVLIHLVRDVSSFDAPIIAQCRIAPRYVADEFVLSFVVVCIRTDRSVHKSRDSLQVVVGSGPFAAAASLKLLCGTKQVLRCDGLQPLPQRWHRLSSFLHWPRLRATERTSRRQLQLLRKRDRGLRTGRRCGARD
jgi:hypothetical protein